MAKGILSFGLSLAVGITTIGCKTEPSQAPQSTQPATTETTLPYTQPATSSTSGANDPNPLFTLPPSRGPAAHQFKQVTLLRDGPSGDLEMQLTGDGIYRVRDHGRGQSYTGSGKLTDEKIAEWAKLMKDWEALKDSYLADPASKDTDKVTIIYGGKKVTFSHPGKENPKAAEEAYNRLLALSEKSKTEGEEANLTPASDIVPENPFGNPPKK